MISPNLLAIWAFLFLNLSQDLIVVLLRYFGTLAMANYCRAVTRSPRGTSTHFPLSNYVPNCYCLNSELDPLLPDQSSHCL
jgi:hypothetical protein